MHKTQERSERVYPAHPLVGVGAVVVDGERVLLVRRTQPPRLHMWTFPGGLVELGETVFDAARRELEEETGIAAQPIDVIDVYEVIERDQAGRVRYQYVIVEVLFRYEGGEPVAGDDAGDVCWWPATALDAPDVGPGVKEIVAKALRMVKG